jgi:hypothetical protein
MALCFPLQWWFLTRWEKTHTVLQPVGLEFYMGRVHRHGITPQSDTQLGSGPYLELQGLGMKFHAP